MFNAEVSAQALAEAAGVDVKSVSRWISEDRVPYPTTRMKVARALDQQETCLWPGLLETSEASSILCAELDQIWPTRSAISSETWHALFNRAKAHLDILVYAGGFLLESLDLADVIRWKSQEGVDVRILIGDPDCDAVAVRAAEERLPWLSERCRTTGRYLAEVRCADRVSVRLHSTTLYASQFRFDDVMLVNGHTFGAWACQSPVQQFRQIGSGHLFDYYRAAYDRVWASSV